MTEDTIASNPVNFNLVSQIIFWALVTYSISEILNYFLVYRKSDYQNLTSNVNSLSKKL